MAKHLRQIVEKNWIQDAVKKPGALTAAAKRAKMSNSEYEQKHKHEGGKAGQRARFALNMKKINKEETQINEVDTISLSVPLFIRMLEFAKEDAKTDMDLHKATENILSMANGKTLDMDSYDKIVEDVELDEGKYTYKTEGPKPKDKQPKWVKKLYKDSDRRIKGMSDKDAVNLEREKKGLKPLTYKFHEETELTEAKWKKSKGPSQKVDIKSKAEIAKEKSGRMKLMRAAKKEVKDTGEKVKFRPFGNWAHKRAAAKRKIQECEN